MEEVSTFKEYLLLGWYKWCLLVQGSITQTVLSCTKSTIIEYFYRIVVQKYTVLYRNYQKREKIYVGCNLNLQNTIVKILNIVNIGGVTYHVHEKRTAACFQGLSLAAYTSLL